MAEIKKATTPAEIVALLQDDMKGEHAAIVQYLQHAYKLGEGEVPSEVEGIARDEMRHFRWLGEKIVELNGDPSMQRDPIFLDLDAPRSDLLLLDIDAEERAITQYREHIEAIDQPDVKIMLQRILKDELTHQQKFRGYVKELGGDPNKQLPHSDTGPWNRNPRRDEGNVSLELKQSGKAEEVDVTDQTRDDHPLVKMLNQRIQEEYATVLLYLHQAFMTQNIRLKSALISDIAVWHMTHLGTLSEAIAENFQPPMEMEPEAIRQMLQTQSGADEAFLQQSIQREKTAADNTLQLMDEIKNTGEEKAEEAGVEEADDLELELSRFVVHHQFQAYQFERLSQGKPEV